MSTAQKENFLRAFLARPRTSGETHPPPIPPELGDLPDQVYIDLALDYIQSYPFTRTFEIFTPNGSKRSDFNPTPDWQAKARAYLTACVNVDRSSLAAIADQKTSPYNAKLEQQHFVHMVVFKRRWELEAVTSELLALVQLFRSETRIASSVATPAVIHHSFLPMTTVGKSRDRTISENVQHRDLKCRMTGVSRKKKKYTAEEVQQFDNGETYYGTLEVAHGLPFGMGEASFPLVTALTGVQCKWKADCVENAILLQSGIHTLFGCWKLHLEWTPDGQVMIRARSFPDIKPDLSTEVNAKGQLCHRPGALIDQPLRRPHNDSIADIDPKFFILHKFIGDIVWMCGGAEPISDDEEEYEDEEMCVTEYNLNVLMDKLNAPEMNLVPREREGMFGVRTELVPKNEVWAN
ncbi:hypothetical protein GGX14DRAFT_636239, partial [Mycena pura]